MRPVEDADGNRYLLEKRSAESSRVRDLSTGEVRHLPNDDLMVIDASSLETAATAVDADCRTLLRSVHDDVGVGLLVELGDAGPTGVRTLLARYDLCESDLHGRLTTLTAGGLIEEVDVAGERGYGLTDTGQSALARIRESGRSED